MKIYIRITSIGLLTLLISCSGAKTGNDADHAASNDTLNHDSIQQNTQVESQLIEKEVSYEADGINMNGFLVYDASQEGERPGVVVVHEWWGHNEHTRNSARKLAEEGYVAFALDMYGDGKNAEHPEDAKAFAGSVMKNFESAKARFDAAVAVLKSSEICNESKTAAIGYCFGGGIVLNMARQGANLDAVATFHGNIAPIVPAQKGDVQAELLVMNGAEDPFVSEEAIQTFKQEMNNADVTYEFVNYPGAVHAFTNPDATEKGKQFDLPLAYNQEADEQSWEKCMQFFEKVLKAE